MQDAVDQLLRHVTRVVPLPVVAHAEIEYVDIFIPVTRIDVEKEKRVKHHEQHYQQPDGIDQRFRFQHDDKRCQPGGVHGDEQPGVFANKADAKARAIVALFTSIEIVDGSGKQALYLCHFLPL